METAGVEPASHIYKFRSVVLVADTARTVPEPTIKQNIPMHGLAEKAWYVYRRQHIASCMLTFRITASRSYGRDSRLNTKRQELELLKSQL